MVFTNIHPLNLIAISFFKKTFIIYLLANIFIKKKTRFYLTKYITLLSILFKNNMLHILINW